METIEQLISRGYRLYKIDMRITSELKNYFKTRLGRYIDYHPHLKLIAVKDVKAENRI